MPENNLNIDRVGGVQVTAAAGLPVAIISGGLGGGGGASTIADGADVVEGTLLDAAVTSDSVGTVSGKLRGLVKILADIWDSVNHRIKVDGSSVTQPVSGTFFQATQPVSGTVSINSIPAGAAVIGHVIADAGSTTAVTGNVTAVQATGTNLHVVVDTAPTTAVTAASLPLPALAATSTKQSDGSQKTQVVDGSGNVIGATSNALDVNIKSGSIANTGFNVNNVPHVIVDTAPSTAVTGTFFQATQPVSIASMPSTPVTGTFFQATQPVSATSLPLPTGAAADSSLTTINTSLTTLDTDLKASQPRAVTQTTSPWVVSNNDGQLAAARYEIRQIAQQAEIFSAQPQNGFVPMSETPAFLGGF